jgi:hypothetical protein
MAISKLAAAFVVSAGLAAGVVGGLAGVGVLGQPEKKDGAAALPAMPPDQQKMMDDWMKSMAPGEAHKRMQKHVGTWDCTMRAFMGGPGAPPMESKGIATIKMALGDKFQIQEFEGEMMGMPMKGMGMNGFDNTRKIYVGTWADTFSTTISYMTGGISPDGKILTMFAQMDEPMTGEMGKTVKYVTRFIDDDTMKFEAWEVMYGNDFIAFEIDYKRAK